jgi:U4/U6.U5 tri-snRNP-associated protein 1
MNEYLKEKNQHSDDNNDDDNEDCSELLYKEPVLDRGLSSCLKLAITKGYLEHEEVKKNAKLTKQNIEAVNYMVEDRNFYDIDDKYTRGRDRFSGPLVDFQEKSNYKPNVKIDYVDEKGRNMNEKEAFRYLSHRFHGKGSGKKKTEKRNKKDKEAEALNAMSSTDTPLNTVALLVEKQKQTQQPFVVLSAPKGKNDQIMLHKR